MAAPPARTARFPTEGRRSKMRAVLHRLPAPLRSLLSLLRGISKNWLGMRLALRHAVAEPPETWSRDFAGARVLVVGTGPSLDLVSDDYFAAFDVLVCVNHAVLRAPAHRCTYYFSTDLPRTREVTQVDRDARIGALPIARRVLLLSTVKLAPYLLSGWLRDFTVWRYAAYDVMPWGEHWSTWTLYRPRFGTDEQIAQWIDGAGRFRDMLSPTGTSASCAVLFAARFRPAEIRLIGVDLNTGRAEAFQQAAGGGHFFGAEPVEKYRRLEGLVRRCGIPVENDSWSVVPHNDPAAPDGH